jgi:sarcosine oxidase subunit gamma
MADLAASSALAHVTPLSRRDLTLREDPSLRVFHLLERREDPGFRQRVAQTFGVEAPVTASTVAVGSASLAWISPGQWFALGAQFDAPDGVDVSDAQCALRLTGARATELLSKSVPVDLSAGAFPVQTCARTLMGSIPVFVMRDEDGFLILVERSLAHAAWTWLADGANALSR